MIAKHNNSLFLRYRMMWVWTLFDLPVLTKIKRKNATRFRNDLLDLGFKMVQFSVYLRHAHSKEKADAIAAKVGQCVSETGHVQVLFFTIGSTNLRGATTVFTADRPLNKNPINLHFFKRIAMNFSAHMAKSPLFNRVVQTICCSRRNDIVKLRYLSERGRVYSL